MQWEIKGAILAEGDESIYCVLQLLSEIEGLKWENEPRKKEGKMKVLEKDWEMNGRVFVCV